MPALRRTAGLLLALAAALAPAVPAWADDGPPAPAPAAGSLPPLGVAGTSATLDQQVAAQQSAVVAQTARLQASEHAAARALEARQQAERAAAQADRTARADAAQLAAATAVLDRSRTSMDGFAAALYRGGAPRLSYLTAALVTPDPAGLLHEVSVAQQVGDAQAQDYRGFLAAAAAQRAAAQASHTASTRAARLRAEAARAQADADAAVAAQTALVDAGQAHLVDLVQAAAEARRHAQLLARAELLARQRAAVPVAAVAGALATWTSAGCRGGDLAGYPDGELPAAALCPLWGTTGMVLRADAAAAFGAMSHAYAAATGEPLCVTDSYRSLAEQVAVRAARPTLAAVPGTSNHGWGVAVDLCGGVEQFGSPAHTWLDAHAAAYGWFHPAWAEPTGSTPEPWHWEFAG